MALMEALDRALRQMSTENLATVGDVTPDIIANPAGAFQNTWVV